jgi:branched-chain amino acid transport system ATP-binding protein
MSTLVSVRNVSKRFGGVVAIEDVSFDVASASITSVIGPNGAGKTTLMNILSAVIRPSAGQVIVGDQHVSTLKPHEAVEAGVARTFQNLAVFKHSSVMENILVGMHRLIPSGMWASMAFLGKARRSEIHAREVAEEIIEFLEIEAYRDVPVGTLSYGLQKRVELARALACRPRLLILDEMVSGMNQEETEDIARFVLDLKEERELTVVMVEHDMRIVMDISDKVVVLNFGRKIAEGAPADVINDPAVQSAYVGASAS